MERATISPRKNHLSRDLRKGRAGEPVLIRDRDEPVASWTAIDRGGRPHGRLDRLERQGVIRRALEPVPLERLREPSGGEGAGVLEALLAERRDGR